MTRQRVFNIRILSAFVLFLGILTVLMVLAATATAQNPVPFVDQPLVPDATAPGGAGFTLTVNGAGFVPASVVSWSGSPRATTFISSSTLAANILASDIATESTAAVTVVSPSPGGGVSNIQFFSIATATASVSFLPAATYKDGGVYAQPYSVAIGDLNGDGHQDIAVFNNGSVGVLLGNGDGTFKRIVTYGSGGWTTSGTIAIADLNNDGKPDLVVMNSDSGNVGVLLGNGDGTFQPAGIYYLGGASGFWPGAVTVADMNLDGKLDIVADNATCSDSILLLLGKGDGTFIDAECGPNYYSGGSGADSVAAAVLTGDGKPDVVAANEYSNNVGVLLGNGDGTLQSVVSYGSGGSAPLSVAVADVNGDNKPDFVVANQSGETNGDGSIGVLLGNGNGTFQPAVVYDSGGVGASGVAVADVNADGIPDLVVTNAGSNNISVLLGNGDGTFQTAVSFASGGVNPRSIAVSDTNDDGRPDLVVANYSSGTISGTVSVLLNNSGPHAPTRTTVTSSVNPAYAGRRVTYRATVTGEPGESPTGTVTFYDGLVAIATVALAGNQAAHTATYTGTQMGIHPITASYSGDLHNSVSTSAVLAETVLGFLPKTVVITSGSPTFFGQPVTFTATVISASGTIPDGELVTFYDGTTVMGSVPLAGGKAAYTTSSLSGGKTHYVKAKYAGDATFAPSSGTAIQVVERYPTTTTFVSSPNPSTYGQLVTWTATVTTTGPNVPTGNVRFVGASGPGTLSAGIAIYKQAWLQAGTHAVTAEYKGDAANAPSSSAAANQVVNPAPTVTTITSSANPSSSGQMVTFRAHVASSTGAHPTGTVTFTAAGITLGTVSLSGVVAVSTATLPVGLTTIEAIYNGTTDFVSSSATLTQTVNP
jgi:hypothetical protein